jgi:hypothetical protein
LPRFAAKRRMVRVASPRALPLTMVSAHMEVPSSRPEALAMPPGTKVLVSSGHQPRRGATTYHDMETAGAVL